MTSRRAAIATLVSRRGFVTFEELAGEWGISLATVRRDVADLADRGLLSKRRGGASSAAATEMLHAVLGSRPVRPWIIPPDAADLIRPGMTIGVCAGPIALSFADAIMGTMGITCVTNSVPLARLLWHGGPRAPSAAEVVLLPGSPDALGGLAGPLTATALEGIALDLVFMDVGGFDQRRAAFTTRLRDLSTVEAFLRASTRAAVFLGEGAEADAYPALIRGINHDDLVVLGADLPDAVARDVRAGGYPSVSGFHEPAGGR